MNYRNVELGTGLRPNANNCDHIFVSGGAQHAEGCVVPKRVPGIATWSVVSRRLFRELKRFPAIYAAYLLLGPLIIYKICKSMLLWTKCNKRFEESREVDRYRNAHLGLLDQHLDVRSIEDLVDEDQGETMMQNDVVQNALAYRAPVVVREPTEGNGFGVVGHDLLRPRRPGRLTMQILMIVREKHGVLANTEANRMIVRRTILMQDSLIQRIRPTHMVQWLPMMITLAMTPTKHEIRCAQILNPPDSIFARISRFIWGDELQDRIQEMNRLRNV